MSAAAPAPGSPTSDPGLSWNALGTTIGINVALVAISLLLYCVFATQKSNARVYFPRWFVLDEEEAKKYEGKGLELNPWKMLQSMRWVSRAIATKDEDLLEHCGLDMLLVLRMYQMAWRIFVPIMVVSAAVLFPLYITGGGAANINDAAGSVTNINALTIGALPPSSKIFWVVVVLAYVYSAWILYIMGSEFERAAKLRLKYSALLPDRPDQFSVLVRQVPVEGNEQPPQATDKFFSELHPETYLLTQACYNVKDLPKLVPKLEYKRNRLEAFRIRSEQKGMRLTTSKGCCGPKVDAIDYTEEEVQKLEEEVRGRQQEVLSDPQSLLPACVVSFRSRRGAAVAAQTLQSSDPAHWITTWAPEPQDIWWPNLTINYNSLGMRRIVVAFVVAAICIGYTVPVAIVQSFANLSFLESNFPWLKPILDIPFINAFLQGFLPGLGLMIFLLVLPPILIALSKLEGYVAVSEIDRAAAGKHFYFKIVAVFLANVLLGTALQSVQIIVKNPGIIPNMLGTAIPAQATFFITFTMINGWVAPAAELFRGWGAIIIFHIKNKLLVTTPEDRVKAMSAPNPPFFELIPDMEMYFLLSFIYMIVAPFYLPFAVIYFLWAWLVFRNQFINVYSPAYDLRGGFWPHFHARAITSLVFAQFVLVIIVGLKQCFIQAIVLLFLPLFTMLLNYWFIFDRFTTVFNKDPLDSATRKDKEDADSASNDPRLLLEGAYLHSTLKALETDPEASKGAQGDTLADPAAAAAAAAADESGVPLMTSAPDGQTMDSARGKED